MYIVHTCSTYQNLGRTVFKILLTVKEQMSKPTESYVERKFYKVNRELNTSVNHL